mmetsp:Transcript_8581/g.14580  ORF Transcript_8581/g.14580 Transcript_8581/m.14580 type:complete len:86 (+) Transcript_8581:224-481(+)
MDTYMMVHFVKYALQSNTGASSSIEQSIASNQLFLPKIHWLLSNQLRQLRGLPPDQTSCRRFARRNIHQASSLVSSDMPLSLVSV